MKGKRTYIGQRKESGHDPLDQALAFFRGIFNVDSQLVQMPVKCFARIGPAHAAADELVDGTQNELAKAPPQLLARRRRYAGTQPAPPSVKHLLVEGSHSYAQHAPFLYVGVVEVFAPQSLQSLVGSTAKPLTQSMSEHRQREPPGTAAMKTG